MLPNPNAQYLSHLIVDVTSSQELKRLLSILVSARESSTGRKNLSASFLPYPHLFLPSFFVVGSNLPRKRWWGGFHTHKHRNNVMATETPTMSAGREIVSDETLGERRGEERCASVCALRVCCVRLRMSGELRLFTTVFELKSQVRSEFRTTQKPISHKSRKSRKFQIDHGFSRFQHVGGSDVATASATTGERDAGAF